MIYSTNIILSGYQFMYLLVISYIAVFARSEPPQAKVLFSCRTEDEVGFEFSSLEMSGQRLDDQKLDKAVCITLFRHPVSHEKLMCHAVGKCP